MKGPVLSLAASWAQTEPWLLGPNAPADARVAARIYFYVGAQSMMNLIEDCHYADGGSVAAAITRGKSFKAEIEGVRDEYNALRRKLREKS